MHFLKTLFNRSTNTNRRSLSKRTKTLSLESLEQRIALDASGVRPQLEAVREVYIDDSLVGPTPIVFGKSELIGQDTKSFVITAVAAGSTVEKWDAAANQWRDVSDPPNSSSPRELLQLMQNRVIQKDDQIRWRPKSTDGVTQKAFEIIGWDDGSETTEPEGVNVPGTVENLEIDIVGDEVRVTWDAPAGGAAVTNYALDQQLDLVTVVPSTQTSHTFAKTASQASYAVTVHANSSEGAGEATTVMLSTGSYVRLDGTVIDPIKDTSGNVLNYDGPNLKSGDESGNMTNLENVVLRNADLTNADLTNADLTNADLTGADLTGANLTGAYLTGATLTGADLEGATLNTGAYNMFGLISGGITGPPASLPTDWRFVDGYLIGPYADLTGATLTGADLTWPTNLSDANLTGATLTGADLTGAALTNATLTGATLTGATLTDVQSGGITGPPASLPTDWQFINGFLIGPSVQLSGEDLTGLDLADMDLTGAILTYANLDQATLTATNLSGANLTGATLTGANLTGATLAGADLEGATLTSVQSGGITGTPSHLPANWQLIDGYLVGPGANLTSANLRNADLTNTNLAGADLTGATLFGVHSGGITGTPHALPTAGPYGNAQWQLIDGYLIGPGADLTGASLTDSNLNNTDLVGANLTNAQLNGVHLDNADLYNATLTGVQSGAITGTILFLPADWRLTTNGYLIGPSANLTNADLSNADLNNLDLSNATLTGVRSGGITGVPHALPTNWQLTNGYLIGPGADLTGATLSSANLTNAYLTNANLANANLVGADLTDARLVGVQSGGITGIPHALPTAGPYGNAQWQLIDGYLIGPGADLTGANLTLSYLDDTDLVGANLTNAVLAHVHLKNADLYNASLTGADLTGSILTNADFTNANLTEATLFYATGAAKYNSATILPAGFNPVMAGWTEVS